jgi:DNA-binding CsgD family transcriptional regulator
VRVEDQGYSLSFGHFSNFGMPAGDALKIIDTVIRAPKRQLGFYTPARIEKWQRNVAVGFPRNSQILQATVSALPRPLAAQMESFETSVRRAYEVAFTKLGVVNECQIRTLVCDGSSLLAWIGAFRPEPFNAQERRFLQALVPALHRRLRLESHWEEAVFNAQAVPVLLESIPSVALIVGASGQIEQANALARRALAQDPGGLRDTISSALRGRQVPSVQLTRISASGWPTYYLAVVASPSGPSGRTELAQRRWNLTHREAEILGHLASGGSNKTIAAALDCAVRTLEQHVTSILEKMQVENRATAIARFWSELGG